MDAYLFERMRHEDRFVLGIDVAGVECTAPADVPRVDILDAASVEQLIEKFLPDEVYYLAAFHHSAEQKLEETRELFEKSFAVQVSGLLNFLEAIRRKSAETRLFYASSARVFGLPQHVPQDETTPVAPDCAYGITKAAGMGCVRYYRRTHSLFAASGILYNHESVFRSPLFVTQKIVRAAVAIKSGHQTKLALGDLDAVVDWGYAPDYVDAMVRMLAMPEPQDFVVATGEPHTVREFAEIAFGLLGLEWERHVEVAPDLISRPAPQSGRQLRAAYGRHRMETFGLVCRDGADSRSGRGEAKCRALRP